MIENTNRKVMTMTHVKDSTRMILLGAVACGVCLLSACKGSKEEVILERFSAAINEALLAGVDSQNESRVTVPVPQSLVGGVLCVAGPYSVSSNDTSLLALVGGAALEEMSASSGFDATRYLFHIDVYGEVVRVVIDWPVFISATHHEVRVAGKKELVLLLDGIGLTGIALQ
ncbi:MAG: hypothetical protein ACI87O_003294 [Planctomycetota bacterium]